MQAGGSFPARLAALQRRTRDGFRNSVSGIRRPGTYSEDACLAAVSTKNAEDGPEVGGDEDEDQDAALLPRRPAGGRLVNSGLDFGPEKSCPEMPDCGSPEACSRTPVTSILMRIMILERM